jgi:hypothetical protein
VVDAAVSTDPEQVPAPLRSAPTGVGGGSQQPPATQAAPSVVDPKQAPTAVRATPEPAPTSVDADPRQEARAARASSTTSQTGSTSPVSDKTKRRRKNNHRARA